MEQLANPVTTTLLTEKEVAKALKISEKTLQRYRTIKCGPPFLKLGTIVRYPIDKLDEWVKSYPLSTAN